MSGLAAIHVQAPLIMVGAGKMGSALLAGWLRQGIAPGGVIVVEPDVACRKSLQSAHGKLTVIAETQEIPAGTTPSAIVFAVKPQQFPSVLPEYRGVITPQTLVVSIAAGKTTGAIEELLGKGTRIVRAMPNLPAAIGHGMIVLYATPAVEDTGRALAGDLMTAAGQIAWIEAESQMDAVTAVSGSGPAYVFHLVEAMAEAGEAAGLPADLAMTLARQTVIGSGALLAGDPTAAGTLRENVTSPGGTTAAALEVLTADTGLRDLLRRAVAAAARRSRELAD